MLLQGEKCFCLMAEDFSTQAVPVNQSSCTIPCVGEDHLCGGYGDHYSVYDLPNVEFPARELRRGSCFTGSFTTDDRGKLIIRQQSCTANSTVICVPAVVSHFTENIKIYAVADKNYEEGRISCRSRSEQIWLPSLPSGRNLNTFISDLYDLFVTDNKYTNQNLHRREFWLDLGFKTTHRWFRDNGGKGREGMQNKRNHGAGCSALTRTTKNLLIQNLPCETPLPFLTSCSRKAIIKGSAEDIELATAVGVTGVVCLVLFVSLALVLFVLKRSGRLRVRHKPAFHSTGEWDDESVAARAANRETYLADLQARLSPHTTKGFELKPLTTTTNSNHATTTSTSRPSPSSKPEIAKYMDPKPLNDDYYTEVSSLPVGCENTSSGMRSKMTLGVARSKVAEESSSSLARLVDPHYDVGIYSEPVQETEEHSDRAGAADSEHMYRNVDAGEFLPQDEEIHFLHPPQPSQVSRLPRNDYEEPVITPRGTVHSINGAYSDVDLPPELEEQAEKADFATYSVPHKTRIAHKGKTSSKMSPQREAESDPTYSVPDVPHKSRDDRLSDGEESASVEVGDSKDGVLKDCGSRVPHKVGPRGDLYAQPAKSGVLVVSLKKAANTTL
ncbi:hypothetical protein ACOMHN_042700 [Nucella lapillus]